MRIVTMHFEKLSTLKKNPKCIKFGNNSTHFEKKCFLNVRLYGRYERTLKKMKNQILHCPLYFFFKDNYEFEIVWISLNVLSMISLFERSFDMVVNVYRQDKSGLKQFLHSHTLYTGNSFHPLLDMFYTQICQDKSVVFIILWNRNQQLHLSVILSFFFLSETTV